MKTIKFILKVISVSLSSVIGVAILLLTLTLVDKYSTDKVSDSIYAFVVAAMISGLTIYLSSSYLFSIVNKLK